MHVASGLVSPATPTSPLFPKRQAPKQASNALQKAGKSNRLGINSKQACVRRAVGSQSGRDTTCLLTIENSNPATVSRHSATTVRNLEHLKQARTHPAPPEKAAPLPATCSRGVQSSSSANIQGNIIPIHKATAIATRSLHKHEDGAASQPAVEQHVHDVGNSQQCSATGSLAPFASRVWLPDKQLWVPQSTVSSNGTGARTAAIAGSKPAEQARMLTRNRMLSRVYMAAAATRGRKKFMEDRHVVAALDPCQGVQQAPGAVGLQEKVSVAAVFDGHAGYATAAYAAQHIPNLLHEALSGRAGNRSEGGPRFPQRGLLAPTTALAASFHWFDRWWADARCDPSFTEHGWDDSGSTAVVGMVYGQELVVANAGDSVALLASGGQSHRLTVEHRLDNEQEVERVLEAGGRVVAFKPGAVPRVMGNSSQTRFKGSMVTRSLGDFAFKHPQALISADPYVAAQQLTPADRLVVMTSDGVTDVLPDDDMLEVAIRAIEQTQQCTNNGQALAKAAANAVMNAALDGGSRDNITVVTILLDWDCEYSTN